MIYLQALCTSKPFFNVQKNDPEENSEQSGAGYFLRINGAKGYLNQSVLGHSVSAAM